MTDAVLIIAAAAYALCGALAAAVFYVNASTERWPLISTLGITFAAFLAWPVFALWGFWCRE